MSNLATPGGDDHPEAAGKHLLDAEALLHASRADGAAYHCGYVIECSLKTLWLHENRSRTPPVTISNPWGGGNQGHQIAHLKTQVSLLSSVATSAIAPYFKTTLSNIMGSPLGGWRPSLRYQAPHVSLADAAQWHAIAKQAYEESVGQMYLDGIL